MTPPTHMAKRASGAVRGSKGMAQRGRLCRKSWRRGSTWRRWKWLELGEGKPSGEAGPYARGLSDESHGTAQGPAGSIWASRISWARRHAGMQKGIRNSQLQCGCLCCTGRRRVLIGIDLLYSGAQLHHQIKAAGVQPCTTSMGQRP